MLLFCAKTIVKVIQVWTSPSEEEEEEEEEEEGEGEDDDFGDFLVRYFRDAF